MRDEGGLSVIPEVSASPSVPPIVIDFFSGCGGTSAGLRRAGLRIVAAVDFDPAASATYRANFPEAEFHEIDVRKLPLNSFDHLMEADTPIVFSACAPCQPYSSMRPRDSRQRPRERSLLLSLLPFVDRLWPDSIVVENVPGLQKVSGASTWNRFLRHLERGGYSIRWDVVDCRNYGVPQRRRRLVLLASRHGGVDLPAATHGVGGRPYSTVRDWIGHLPPLDAGETCAEDPIHRAGRLGEQNLRRIMATPEGGSRSDWPAELWLECHKRAKGHQDSYGRMRFDESAPVLTTKCTDITNGRYGHPSQNRGLSVREAALLQTFPQDFTFIGGLRSMTKQIGNAVPVLVAEAMGRQVAQHLQTERAARNG
ncbi:MAG: DNA cytosine methyltransferase [Propionibacteriaceae bacterium]|jgi:DNA (cytosine-5)-methyltransferase 1|nr:DNA cytosine methyltransferase [Propionibacteriaceae bacterium]